MILVALVLLGAGHAVPPSAASRVPAACATVTDPARTALARADAALARRDARGANRELDAGLARLGGAYSRPDLVDDTGMRLVLARSHERRQPRRAALDKRGVLAERLALCGQAAAGASGPRSPTRSP